MATVTPDRTSTGQITVYGSCVARNAANELENRGWKVESHIARQSLISAGRSANVGDLDLSLLRSSFARRSFLSDMVGNLEAQLTAAAHTDPGNSPRDVSDAFAGSSDGWPLQRASSQAP